MRHSASTLAPLAVATALLAAGCARQLDEDKPTPPDMGALVKAYAEPTAPLSAATGPLIEQILGERLGPLYEVCGWAQDLQELCGGGQCPDCTMIDQLLAPFGELADATGGSPADGDDPGADDGLAVGDVALEGEGFVRVHRICGGHGPEPVADAANGAIELIFGFTEDGLDPVVWGDFAACRMLVGGQAVDIDASVAIETGGLATFSGWGEARLIIRLDGELVLDGQATALDIDFELSPERAGLAFRVVLPDGTNVNYAIGPEGAGLRTENGDWTCDFTANWCERQRDGQRVSW